MPKLGSQLAHNGAIKKWRIIPHSCHMHGTHNEPKREKRKNNQKKWPDFSQSSHIMELINYSKLGSKSGQNRYIIIHRKCNYVTLVISMDFLP